METQGFTYNVRDRSRAPKRTQIACHVCQLSLAYMYLRFADQFFGGPLVYKYCLTPCPGAST